MERKHLVIGHSTDDKREPTISLDIEIRKGGTLSICGNIGRDQAGQCQDSIKELMIQDAIKYREGWNKEKLFTVLKVWDEWHLNDMHPECEHQAKDGTLEEARQEATIYGYKLKPEISSQQRDIMDRVETSIKKTRHASITEAEQVILNLEYSLKTLETAPPTHYETTSDSYWGNKTERRGWIRFEEFPTIGILGKPCNTCGYKYGSEWKKVELPAEVIELMKSL